MDNFWTEDVFRDCWYNWKKHFLFSLINGAVVQDPSQEHRIVSEGSGYGMLLSTFLDDQETFDQLLAGLENYFLVTDMEDQNGGLFGWIINQQGRLLDNNSATDADQDIAQALIQAQHLVETNKWKPPLNPHTGQSDREYYGHRAQELLDAIWEKEVVRIYNGENYPHLILRPSAHDWCLIGKNGVLVNPSYISPAWWKTFSHFDYNLQHDWLKLIEDNYILLSNLISKTENHQVPDWCEVTIGSKGNYEFDRARNHKLKFTQTYDAIRVPWRIGVDALWTKDPRAIVFCRQFAAGANPQFVQVDKWHDEIAVSMYYIGALGSGDITQIEAFEKEMRRLYSGHGYFRVSDPHAETRYFNQSLALFSALVAGNKFQNIAG